MQDQGQACPGLLVIADDPDQEVDMCDSAWLQQNSTCSWWAVLVGLLVLFAVVCWLRWHPCPLNHLDFFIAHRGCVLLSTANCYNNHLLDSSTVASIQKL